MKTVDWVRTLTDDQLVEWREKMGDGSGNDGADGLKLIRVDDEIDRRKAAKRG